MYYKVSDGRSCVFFVHKLSTVGIGTCHGKSRQRIYASNARSTKLACITCCGSCSVDAYVPYGIKARLPGLDVGRIKATDSNGCFTVNRKTTIASSSSSSSTAVAIAAVAAAAAARTRACLTLCSKCVCTRRSRKSTTNHSSRCQPAGGCPNPRGRRASVLPAGFDVGVRLDEGPASPPVPPAGPPQRAGLDAAPLPAVDNDDQGGWLVFLIATKLFVWCEFRACCVDSLFFLP